MKKLFISILLGTMCTFTQGFAQCKPFRTIPKDKDGSVINMTDSEFNHLLQTDSVCRRAKIARMNYLFHQKRDLCSPTIREVVTEDNFWQYWNDSTEDVTINGYHHYDGKNPLGGICNPKNGRNPYKGEKGKNFLGELLASRACGNTCTDSVPLKPCDKNSSKKVENSTKKSTEMVITPSEKKREEEITKKSITHKEMELNIPTNAPKEKEVSKDYLEISKKIISTEMLISDKNQENDCCADNNMYHQDDYQNKSTPSQFTLKTSHYVLKSKLIRVSKKSREIKEENSCCDMCM